MKKLRMIVDIIYEDAGIPIDELKWRMKSVIEFGMGDGHFTGDTEATIEDWKVSVEDRSGDLFSPNA